MTPKRSSGQALVECVVAALFVLVPLLLAMSALGKLADVRHTTLMAARYAAWERTVWYEANDSRFDARFAAINGGNRKSAAQIRSEIALRLVGDRASAGGTIRRADGSARGFANGSDPLWHDGAGRAFLAHYDQLETSVAQRAPGADIAGAARAAIDAVALPAGVSGSLAPPLPDGTLAVVDVAFLRIGADSQAYARLWPGAGAGRARWTGLDFAARGAILSNTWSANGSHATERMVAASVPTAQGLGKAIGGSVHAAMQAWDPLAPVPDFGRIAPDVVPTDRLRP